MPYSGTLMTRVFTSRSQLPVEDAAVSILQHEPGGRQRLINIQTSDRSGNTVPTIIETPDAQNSQSPGQETPFSLCTGPIKEGAVLCQLSSHRIFQPISPFI